MTEGVAVDVLEKLRVLSLDRPTALIRRSEYSARLSWSCFAGGISTDNCETRDRPPSSAEEGPAGG